MPRPVPCCGGGQAQPPAPTLCCHGGRQIWRVAVVERICPSPPRRSVLAPSTPHVRGPSCALHRVTLPPSCRLARYTRSPAAVSFWFARSLIRIESPTACRPRTFYSGIGIDFIDTVSEYCAHLLRAIGLLLCRLIGPQHRRPCLASSLHLHRRHLCIDDLHNPCCAIHLHKVFVLLIGSSSSSCHYPRRR